METLEILKDRELVASIKRSKRDLKEGKVLSYKELLQELDIGEEERKR